jgi:lysophospholipase L1-like esterase
VPRIGLALVGAVVVAAVVVVVVGRDGDGVDEIRRTPITSDTIVLLGDSITALGDWAQLLPGRPVANAGHPGYTSAQLVPIAAEVAASRPAAVFVLAGTNDIRDGLPAETTGEHLGQIIEAIASASPGTRIVLQTLLPRADAVAAVRDANLQIERVAAEHDVELLRLTESFDDGAGGLRVDETPDGIHLDDRGYRRWAAIIEQALAT